MKPILTRSEITDAVYIVTKYKILEDGVVDAIEKCDVTDQFDAMTEPMRAKNAKLRDLVSVVYGYYASGTISPCDICDSIGCQYVGEAESGCRYHDRFDRAEAADDEIHRRMRELGIEVE